MCAGVTVQPSDGWWHVMQARPFVPTDLKNGFARSIRPFTLIVAWRPDSSSNTSTAGSVGANADALATTAVVTAQVAVLAISSRQTGVESFFMRLLGPPRKGGLDELVPRSRKDVCVCRTPGVVLRLA